MRRDRSNQCLRRQAGLQQALPPPGKSTSVSSSVIRLCPAGKGSADGRRRSSRLGNADVGAAEGSLRLREVTWSADGTVDPKLATVGGARTRAGSAAAQGAVAGVAGASTGP